MNLFRRQRPIRIQIEHVRPNRWPLWKIALGIVAVLIVLWFGSHP